MYKIGNLSLARAVRASAAFPGLLPPVQQKISAESAAGYAEERSRTLLLADGGVYNNLGSEWIRKAPGLSHNTDHLILKPSHHKAPNLHLVVDAGAEVRRSPMMVHNLPLVGWVFTLYRTYMATYESTLEIRRSFLLNANMYARGSEWLISSKSRPGWGAAVPDGLELGANTWRFIAWTTRTTATTLMRVPRGAAARMMAHGYALCLRAIENSDLGVSTTSNAWQSWLKNEVLASIPKDETKFEQARERLRRKLPKSEYS